MEKLLRSPKDVKNFDAEQVAKLTFSGFLVLEIFRNDPYMKKFVMEYANYSLLGSNYYNFFLASTDLRNLVYVLYSAKYTDFNYTAEQMRNKKQSKQFLEDVSIDSTLIRQYFKRLSQGYGTSNKDMVFLRRLERDLNISDVGENYNSMRVLVEDWKNQGSHRKKLVTTRLLLAIRTNGRRFDLRKPLEKYAKQKDLEMKNVNNPETGEPSLDAQKQDLKKDLKKAGAGVLGTVAGAVIGSKLGWSNKDKK